VGWAKLSRSGTGGADVAWEADCNGEVDAVVPGSTALFVGGGFTQVAGQARPGIAALTYTPLRLLSPHRLSGGQFQCTLSGERGQNFEILASTDLVNWATITNLINSTGTTDFTDPTTGLTKRFYRAHQLPTLTVPPLQLRSPQRLGGGMFQCTVSSEPGLRLEILASSNLLNWTSIATLTNTTGTTNFTDATTGLSKRFYRAHQLP
jgi:hypothetical protein